MESPVATPLTDGHRYDLLRDLVSSEHVTLKAFSGSGTVGIMSLPRLQIPKALRYTACCYQHVSTG